MRFLFGGDIVGRPGREAALALVPALRRELRLDAVILNCENAADGRGILPEQADRLLAHGVDVLTGGNHLLAQPQILAYLSHQPRLVRSANDPRAPGWGSYALKLRGGRTLGVIQVEGQVFMRRVTCPFAAVRQQLQRLGPCTAILVDVHAEASSEKQALGHYLAGKVSAVLGSHTHVQTADERLLAGHTAYLTDVGMTGPYDSVIGMQADCALQRFLQPDAKQPPHQVAEDDIRLCGAVVETCDQSGRALSIVRLQRPWRRGARAA